MWDRNSEFGMCWRSLCAGYLNIFWGLTSMIWTTTAVCVSWILWESFAGGSCKCRLISSASAQKHGLQHDQCNKQKHGKTFEAGIPMERGPSFSSPEALPVDPKWSRGLFATVVTRPVPVWPGVLYIERTGVSATLPWSFWRCFNDTFKKLTKTWALIPTSFCFKRTFVWVTVGHLPATAL